MISMSNNLNSEIHPFVQKEWIKLRKTEFISKLLLTLVGYVGITLWLNNIRATAPLWLVWFLIIVQLLLYFSIFSSSYLRFKSIKNNNFGFPLFLVLAILGRVENWEILVIPLTTIYILIISAKNNVMQKEDTL